MFCAYVTEKPLNKILAGHSYHVKGKNPAASPKAFAEAKLLTGEAEL